jgi:hypothetical protein
MNNKHPDIGVLSYIGNVLLFLPPFLTIEYKLKGGIKYAF